MTPSRSRTIWALLWLGVLMLAVQEFAWHALSRGFAGFGGDAKAIGRLAGSATAELGIFLHMITGGAITMLAVIQLAGPVRRRWPRAHRISGRALAPLALLTGIGGLVYIALQGTIGGPLMSVGFGLYGGLMILAAIQTPRFAMQRDYQRHRRWGLRLIVLALGSWIYRVHYGVWYGITCSMGEATCGLASNDAFTGLFDQIQVFAFYLPYLLLLEWWMRRSANPELTVAVKP